MYGNNGLYTETCVKRKLTLGLQFLRVLAVAGAVLLFFGGFVFAQGIIMVLGVGALVAVFFLLPLFNVEWEYVFCDGQIDFDRISGGEKRKTMLRIDMDNVEILAPAGSHHLDSYNNLNGVSVRKFISNEPGKRQYVAYTNKGSEKLMVVFEPDDKMIDYAKQKSPRKVFTD